MVVVVTLRGHGKWPLSKVLLGCLEDTSKNGDMMIYDVSRVSRMALGLWAYLTSKASSIVGIGLETVDLQCVHTTRHLACIFFSIFHPEQLKAMRMNLVYLYLGFRTNQGSSNSASDFLKARLRFGRGPLSGF